MKAERSTHHDTRPPSPPCLKMPAAAWPLPCDLLLVKDAWQSADPEERRRLSAVDDDDLALYFKVAEALLKSKLINDVECLQQRAEYIARLQLRCGLDMVEWTMVRPRTARLGLSFCECPESLDFILQKSTYDFSEFLQVVKAARSGVPKGEDPMARCTTWNSLSKDFFTVVLSRLIVKCRRQRDGELLLLLRAVAPAEPPPAKKSWPSRKLLLELKSEWAGMSVAERRQACELAGAPCWLVRAAEMMVGSNLTKACLQSGLFRKGVLESAEYERLRLKCLEETRKGFGDEDIFLHLSESFAQDAGCLDHIAKHAARSVGERDELLFIAQTCSEISVAVAQTELERPLVASWTSLARILFTLILASLEDSHHKKKQEAQLEAKASREAAEKAAAKDAVRKAARKARRVADKLAMEEAVRLAVKEAMQEERRRIAAILQKEWRQERLHYDVVRTFVEVQEPEEEEDPTVSKTLSPSRSSPAFF